ncbi:MAG: ArnT family glycosyltransferase [Planctomycetales bacterium]
MTHAPATSIDDQRLRELAAQPSLPLFPVLQHAEAMAPLVIVLAFLPTLYAVAYRTLTEAGARQGLLSLQCLGAQSLGEFVDPVSAGAAVPLAYQPPLINWLTAAALRLFGVGHATGHVAAAYLCTAGLILAAYQLARRLGGARLGLFTALLLAFNPHVLKLAQEPVPQSAALLFALLAITGVVAHWQKSAASASMQLLFGGICLGLCLLAGGPVATMVVAILFVYVVCGKVAGMRRGEAATSWDSQEAFRNHAAMTVLILAATGFAVAGWRPMLMGSRHGLEFWQAWLGLEAIPASRDAVSGARWLALAERWNLLVLPLTILALAGLATIVNELIERRDESRRRHRGLLLVWLVLAGGVWSWGGWNAAPGETVPESWKLMLVVCLNLLAAVGLSALIDRRIPMGVALGMGLVTCLDLVLIASRRETPPALQELLADRTALWLLLPGVAPLLVLAAVRFGQAVPSTETWRRGALTGLALGLVGANCLWGAVAVRRSNSGDRELDDLRAGFSRITGVRVWMFVTPPVADYESGAPPAQLEYTLRSLWPEATMQRLYSFESLAARMADQTGPGATGEPLVVTWSPQQHVRVTVPAGLLKSAAHATVYRGHEVGAYYLDDSPAER